jgi:peptide/nickel transport system substrate-binding protein
MIHEGRFMRRSSSVARLRILAGPTALAVVLLLSLVTLSASSAAATKPTLSVGDIQPPPTLDPSSSGGGPPLVVLKVAYDSLITHDQAGNFAPMLATKWQFVGKTNTHFRLWLRHGVRFSDGSQMNAAAVVNWFNYVANVSPSMVRQMGKFTRVYATGTDRVDFIVAKPNPSIPELLTTNWGFVASPAGTQDPAGLAAAAKGNAGPYTIVPSETVAGNVYTYVPNKYYYDQSQIHWSKITVKIITSAAGLLQTLETGGIDAAYGSYVTAEAAHKAGYKVYAVPGGVNQLRITDTGGAAQSALANLSVREAMEMAIDRPALATAFSGRYGAPTSNMELGVGYTPTLNNYWKYDPTKAKAMLAAAGYPNGFSFSVYSWVDPTVGSTVLNALAKYFSNVGITMNIYQPTGTTDWINTALGSKGKYEGAQLLTNIQGAGSNVLDTYNTFYGPTSIMSAYGANDPTLQSLATQAATAGDPAPIMQKMNEYLVKQAFAMPLYRFPFLWFVNSKTVGKAQISRGDPLPRVEDWTPAG